MSYWPKMVNAYSHALLFLTQQHVQAFVKDKDIIQ